MDSPLNQLHFQFCVHGMNRLVLSGIVIQYRHSVFEKKITNCHAMKTLSVLWAFCEGNASVTRGLFLFYCWLEKTIEQTVNLSGFFRP